MYRATDTSSVSECSVFVTPPTLASPLSNDLAIPERDTTTKETITTGPTFIAGFITFASVFNHKYQATHPTLTIAPPEMSQLAMDAWLQLDSATQIMYIRQGFSRVKQYQQRMNGTTDKVEVGEEVSSSSSTSSSFW